MKKLMFSLLVGAFCALSSSAAQFSWKWAGTAATDKGYAGGTVYCVLASALPAGGADKFESISAIASAAISSATIVSTSKAVSANATARSASIAVGDTPQYYLVISDGTKYTYTGPITANAAVADGINDVDPVTGDILPSGTATTKSTSFQASTATWVTPTGGGSGGVPEPTSGLLLALGGAMLALRRRRA